MRTVQHDANDANENQIQPNIAAENDLQINLQTLSGPPLDSEPNSKHDYEIGHFVLVRHECPYSSSSRNLWLGQISQVNRKKDNDYAHSLKVRWFDRSASSNDGRNILHAVFDPCYRPVKKKARKSFKSSFSIRQKKDEAWTDTIHTDTVKVTFTSLTKRRSIPLSVQSKIASAG